MSLVFLHWRFEQPDGTRLPWDSSLNCRVCDQKFLLGGLTYFNINQKGLKVETMVYNPPFVVMFSSKIWQNPGVTTNFQVCIALLSCRGILGSWHHSQANFYSVFTLPSHWFPKTATFVAFHEDVAHLNSGFFRWYDEKHQLPTRGIHLTRRHIWECSQPVRTLPGWLAT